MNRREQIEEASEKYRDMYTDCTVSQDQFASGFREGASWADRVPDNQLRSQLSVAVEALNKIAIPDEVNANFSKAEHECAYYIEVSEKALEKIKGMGK